MDETDRHKIMSNLTELSKNISYDSFKDQCRARGLVNHIMIREIEKHNENEETKCCRLLTKLTKRGPRAFATLKVICWDHFQEAFKILYPTYLNAGEWSQAGNSMTSRIPELLNFRHPSGAPSTQHHLLDRDPDKASAPLRPPVELRPYEEEVSPDKKLPPFILSNRIHLHAMVTAYPMRSKHRGVLFFVNIINFPTTHGTDKRNGADMDRKNLIWVFRQMGFVVFYYEDIVFRELDRLLATLVKSEHLRRTDCLVFSLMTHGSRTEGKEFVQFTDGGHVNIQDIIGRFYNDTCELLRGKPKVFILPYCRGDKPDKGVSITQRRVETDGFNVSADRNLSTKSDILICYGTVKGFETHRDVTEGSWFVQELCNVFAQHAHNTDLEVMLKMVMGRLMNEYRTEQMELQTPSVESWGFRSALFFNPGHYPTNP